MSIKILTKNSIDNTNIDGARTNHFSAGMRSGIVKGAFNEGRIFASASNVIALDSCELRISGHQVIIDSLEAITLNDRPSTPTKYSMIAEIQVSDSSVPSFRLFIQPANVQLKKDNLFKTNNGSGTYQLRIGNFTLGTTGLISDVIRTADIITGGGEGGVADIKFNATATQLSSSSQPEANADYNEETKEWDLNFGIPAGSGTNVTIGGVIQGEWSADFAESERQKSKNLLAYPYKDTTKTTSGITYTDNGDGSITINGTNDGGNANFFLTNTSNYKLSAGTYSLASFVSSNNDVKVVLYDGTYYHQVLPNTNITLTYNNDVSCYIYIAINGGTPDTFNNVVIKPMLVSGTDVGDYQAYNGAIIHEKDFLNTSVLVSEIITETSTHEITFYGLDIVEDGGIYDFVLDSPSFSSAGYPYITINGITSGYSKTTIFTSENSSGEISVKGYSANNQDNFGVGNFWGDSVLIGTLILNNGRVCCDSKVIAIGTNTTYYSMYLNSGYVIANNVTSITFGASSSDAPYKAGTKIKIFKRATNSQTRS